tara:strand:+ start:12003 stop:12134 length:132 start_codon:yes stop_codon:yes gene_type:complete
MTDPDEPTSQVDRGIIAFLSTITALFLVFIIIFNIGIFISEIG